MAVIKWRNGLTYQNVYCYILGVSLDEIVAKAALTEILNQLPAKMSMQDILLTHDHPPSDGAWHAQVDIICWGAEKEGTHKDQTREEVWWLLIDQQVRSLALGENSGSVCLNVYPELLLKTMNNYLSVVIIIWLIGV